jgi:hypothetical protein
MTANATRVPIARRTPSALGGDLFILERNGAEDVAVSSDDALEEGSFDMVLVPFRHDEEFDVAEARSRLITAVSVD